MSRRGRGGRPGLRVGLLPLFLLAGALLGLALHRLRAEAWLTPEPLDREAWNIVSPGLNEKVAQPELGRGTHILGGRLLIRQHAFFRADMLSLKDSRAVGRVELELAPDSGPLRVVGRATGGAPPFALLLQPDAYTQRPDGWIPLAAGGRWVLHLGDGFELEGGGQRVQLSEAPSGAVELTAEAEEVQLLALRLLDPQGALLYGERYDQRFAPLTWWLLAAVVGSGLGAALWAQLRREVSLPGRLLRAAAAALPLALLLGLRSADWLALVERLYLTHTPAWELARWGLGAALLWCAALSLLGQPPLQPRSGEQPTRLLQAWLGLLGLSSLLACRHLHGEEWLTLPIGLLAGAMSLRQALRGGVELRRALLWELPALLLPALLGWGQGLLLALLWRLFTLSAGARSWLERAPGPTADLLFALLLSLLPAAELAVRSSYLRRAWDQRELSGELAAGRGWRDPDPFWASSCGSGAATGIVWAGGSSTGGAYQLRGEPEAFFPARAHQRLCARLPPGVALTSHNYGDGGRDTFTVARSIEHMLRSTPTPRLVVVYTGVNDLMTRTSSLTRKQREQKEQQRGEALRGLAGLGARSRIYTGIGLYLRPPMDLSGPMVPEVPLEDTEENLRRVAAAAAEVGAEVLLLTEHVQQDMRAQLEPYEALQLRLSTELPGVHHLPLEALQTGTDSELLVDRNHLSRAGNDLLGAELAPAIAQRLGWTAP